MDMAATSAKTRILLSEDDPAVRRSIHFLLVAHGYDVRAYTSGSALLSDPQARAGSCLIVDYRMPDIDGVAMLRHLRADGWQGSAILITGYPSAALTQLATTEGFDAVLAKPLEDRILVETVASLANNRGGIAKD